MRRKRSQAFVLNPALLICTGEGDARGQILLRFRAVFWGWSGDLKKPATQEGEALNSATVQLDVNMLFLKRRLTSVAHAMNAWQSSFALQRVDKTCVKLHLMLLIVTEVYESYDSIFGC